MKFLSALIDAAENEFNQMIEEEIQRRIKEQEPHDHHDKPKKSAKIHKKADDAEETSQDSEIIDEATNGALNGNSNGHHHENGNGHTENGVGT